MGAPIHYLSSECVDVFGLLGVLMPMLPIDLRHDVLLFLIIENVFKETDFTCLWKPISLLLFDSSNLDLQNRKLVEVSSSLFHHVSDLRLHDEVNASLE